MTLCNKIFVPIIALNLFSQLSSATPPSSNLMPRVAGGHQCDITEVPFLVILLTIKFCGGSLITYSYVLTAAHCVLPEDLKHTNNTAHAGHMSANLLQIRNFQKVHIHPKFVEELFLQGKEIRYDIALVLVDKPFLPTPATHVATLARLGFTKHCSQVMVPGVGYKYDQESVLRETFEQRPISCVDLTIQDIDSCKLNYPDAIVMDDSFLCTNSKGKDTCVGDSGGPLVCDDVIIGVVSYGGSICGSDISTTYMKIESYFDFIDQVIKSTGFTVEKSIPVNSTHSANTSRANDSAKSCATRIQTWVTKWKLIFLVLCIDWFP